MPTTTPLDFASGHLGGDTLLYPGATVAASDPAFDFPGYTKEQRIAAANAYAAATPGKKYVWIPLSMSGYNVALCPPSAGIQYVNEGASAGAIGTSATISTAGYARGTSGNVANDNAVAVNAAIAAAPGLGATIVQVIAAHLPYNANNVTFNNALRVTREGGNPAVFDVRAYGAAAASGVDDKAPIQAAINAAAALTSVNGSVGAIVWFPAGAYSYNSTIQVPVVLSGSLTLRGEGMRSTYLYPAGPSTNFSLNSDGDRVCFVYGTLTPDASGTFTNQTQYCGWEDMSQSGSQISSGSVVAHQITEMQYGWMRNAIIEAFPNSSIGLYLRGTTVTGGLGTNTTGPHVRLCNFINCVIANIGSGAGTPIGLLLQNADENCFIGCAVGPATGLAGGGANTIFAVWVQLGRNNRWFGCLEQGDTGANQGNYCGWVLGPPQNRAGAPNGQVHMNSMFGDVLEGFSRAVWFQAENGGNLRNNTAYGINPSAVTTPFLDSNATGSNFGNKVYALGTPPVNYFDGPLSTASGAATLSGATPSVAGNNLFTCFNGGATTVTSFTGTVPNQIFWVRLDANTTVRDLNNGGGGDIKCWGRQDIVGQTNMWVLFGRMGFDTATHQLTAPIIIGNASTNVFTVPALLKSFIGNVNPTHGPYRVPNVLFQNAGLNTVSTVDASITSFSLVGSSLDTNNQTIRVTARGRQVTQAGSFNIKFGATVLATVAPAAGENWEFEVTIARTGATTQLANGRTIHGTTVAVIAAQPAETLSGAVTLDFRGSVTSGGTLDLDQCMVEYVSV